MCEEQQQPPQRKLFVTHPKQKKQLMMINKTNYKAIIDKRKQVL